MFFRFLRRAKPAPAPEETLVLPASRPEREKLAQSRRDLAEQVVAELREAQNGPDKSRRRPQNRPADPEQLANFVGVPATRWYLTAEEGSPRPVQVVTKPLVPADPGQLERDRADLGLEKADPDAR